VIVINDESFIIVIVIKQIASPGHPSTCRSLAQVQVLPIHLEGLTETLKNLGNDSRSLRLDLKLGSSKSNLRLLAMSCAIYDPEGSD